MKHIFKLLIIATIITGALVCLAYQSRGYWAFGGEWLVMPMILFLNYALKYDAKE